MKRDKLLFLIEEEGIKYYKYIPKLFAWYYRNYPEYEKITIPHFFRMLIEYFNGGYRVYYLKSSEDGMLGYIVVASGGRRLTCSSKEDIVLGPIWICPNQRGKGYATKGIFLVLHELEKTYKAAYEYIRETNIASIKSVEKNNYTFIGRAKEKGFLRKVYMDNEGELLVYKYLKGE